MGQASGISVKGLQNLIGESTVFNGAAIRVAGGFPPVPKNRGFISIEVYNGVAYYQADGKALWYEGIILSAALAGGQQYFVIANWKEAGIQWFVDTF